MNCPKCDGKFHPRTRRTGISMTSVQVLNVCLNCHGLGWLPFWTPAERAGLKAMGKLIADQKGGIYESLGVEEAILSYIQAARKVKEAK